MLNRITPELAQRWIESYTGAQELGIMRPIRQWWVQYLAKQMSEGLFAPVATIILVKVGEKVCIVNGNHTLRAIALSGATQSLPVQRVTSESEDEVRHMYAAADHGLPRNRLDSFRAYDAPFLMGVNQSDARALASAVMFMMNDFGRQRGSSRRVSDTDLLAAMRPWLPMFGNLLNVAGRSHSDPWYKRLVRRASVCAVAMVTIQYQPEMACRFWESVASGANLKSYSPALRLRDYLVETIPAAGRSKAGQNMEQQDLMAKKAAHCWNQYYLGKQMKLLRVSGDKPLEILGRDSTRATGREVPGPSLFVS